MANVAEALNPGNLASELDRHVTGYLERTYRKLTTYPSVNGAYTELFAALSPEVTMANTGGWSKLNPSLLVVRMLTSQVAPWGRVFSLRADLERGSKSEADGGTGVAAAFWKWSEDQVSKYS